MQLSPYFLGALTNFAVSMHEDDNNGTFMVHDRYCKLPQLYKIHDEYKKVLSGRELVHALQGGAPSRILYGTPTNYFNCKLGKLVRETRYFPFVLERDNWEYLCGLIDMSSQLKIIQNDLQLCIYSDCVELLEAIRKFAGIPASLREHRLVYSYTNVIDLFGKLRSSSKREEFNMLTIGKYQAIHCLVLRHSPDAVFPSKTRYSDVGYDLSVISKIKNLNERTALYDTGLSVQIPFRYYLEIVPRSSLSTSGYIMTNGVGIIDRSYTGTLKVALSRLADDAPALVFPFRCCQLIFREHLFIDLWESEHDDAGPEATTRGDGGFGSTG